MKSTSKRPKGADLSPNMRVKSFKLMSDRVLIMARKMEQILHTVAIKVRTHIC